MDSLLYKTLEIVGINHGSDGRICGLHRTNCGSLVQVGTKLKLQTATIKEFVEVKVPVQVDNDEVSQQPKKRGRPKAIKQLYRSIGW